jgi:hypothetical protein
MSDRLDRIVMEAHAKRTVYHVSRDSTVIEAQEKTAKKPEKTIKAEKKRRGWPKKGESRPSKPETAIEQQSHESTEESLDRINTVCSHGCRKNSRGNIRYWAGYKLHPDVSDTGFPLSAYVSGANVYDNQPAIPMEKTTENKVAFCHGLMDAAYDTIHIKNFIGGRGRVPVIDPNRRR